MKVPSLKWVYSFPTRSLSNYRLDCVQIVGYGLAAYGIRGLYLEYFLVEKELIGAVAFCSIFVLYLLSCLVSCLGF